MADTLLAPDELGDLVDAPEFQAMPFDERKAVFEQGVRDASGWMRENAGWTPETWKGYGEAVGALRSKVTDSETLMEKAQWFGGAAARTLKDSAAVAGVTALDMGVMEPDASFKLPLGNVAPALLRGTVKAAQAGDEMLAQALSDRNDAVESGLASVRKDIDEGNIPFESEAAKQWFQQRSDQLEPAQSEWYHRVETGLDEAATDEVKAYAKANSLATPRHAAMLARYMQTRDPADWDALQSSVLRSPGAVRMDTDEAKAQRDSQLAGMLDSTFGEGAGRYITEAGDPFEWAGALVPLIKGAKIVKAGSKMSKLAKAGDLAKGVGAEMLSEQASLTADDPNASWQQRVQVAKDTFAGALGLTGAGAVIGAVGKRNTAGPQTPGAVVGTQPTAPTPEPSDSGVLAQMAEVMPNPVGAGIDPGLPGSVSRATAGPPLRTPVPAFADPNELAPVTVGAGNVFIDMPKTPAALEAQRQDELKMARIKSAAAATKPSQPVIPDAPYGGRDVLDFVNENVINVPAKGQRTGGEYDWQETADIPKYYKQFLFHGERGSGIDKVAQRAFDENLIADPTPDALIEAIQGTIGARKTYKMEMRQQEAGLQDQERRTTQFDKAQEASIADGGNHVPFDQMYPGDELTIDGERVEVQNVETDEDGYPQTVTLKDGKRFGVLTFDANTRGGVIADEWKPKNSASVTDTSAPSGAVPALDVSNGPESAPRDKTATDAIGAGSNPATGATQPNAQPQPSVNPNLNTTGAEDRAQGFKNLDTSGTTAGFLNTDIINEGVDLIRRGFTNFADWSRAMITRFGQRIRDYLQDVWNLVQKQRGAVGGDVIADRKQEQRSFGKRVREDPRVSEGAKDTMGDPLEYTPLPNAETLAGANAVINQNGLERAAAMVMDDAVQMTDAQRVTLGMQTMMRLDQQARASSQASDHPTAARLYNLMTAVAEKTDKLGTVLGQGVQAFAMWNRMTPEGALMQFEKRQRESNGGKMPRLPKELLGTLGKLRDEINAMPEGSVLRADKMREMLAELARHEGIPMGSVFMAYWYANLLSGLSTQGVNVWGNGLNLMLRTIAAGLANHPADTLQMIRGMVRNWKMAAGEARAAWAGHGSAKGNYKYDVPSIERYAQQNALELILSGNVRDWKYWTTKVMTLGGALRYVFRALTAADAAFWHTAAEGRVHLAASRAARAGHAVGSPEYVQAMADSLGDGRVKFAAALKTAADEMKAAKMPPDTAKQNRRAWQIVEQSRPPALREEAHRFGDLTTYAQEPEGVAGLIYGLLSRVQNAKFLGVPVLRPFVPFARIVSNLTSQGLDWTPIGIARGIRGQHLFGSDKFAPWERKERMAAGVIGTTLAGLVANAAFSNKDDDDKDVPFMIYGMGPPDKAKRAQMPKGWKPYTIKIGNRYISYAETPLVFSLAPVGAGLDKMRYGSQFNEASWGARAWYLMQGGGKALFSQGVLSSLGDLVGTMQGDVKPEKLPAKFTGGVIPFSGLMRDIVPLFDPVKISDETIAASIFRDVPVVRGIAGKPALNIFGEPVKADGWQRVPVVKRFYDEGNTKDKETDFLAKNKLWIPGVPQHGELEMGDYLTKQQRAAVGLPASTDSRAVEMARLQARLLTPAESYQWQQRAGAITRERIAALRKEHEQTPMEPEVLQKRVSAMAEVARRISMVEMVTKLR